MIMMVELILMGVNLAVLMVVVHLLDDIAKRYKYIAKIEVS
jgi:hypothetical protein